MYTQYKEQKNAPLDRSRGKTRQIAGQFEVALATLRVLAELKLASEKDVYVFEELAENMLALNQPAAPKPTSRWPTPSFHTTLRKVASDK